jgi:hypothetical protein
MTPDFNCERENPAAAPRETRQHNIVRSHALLRKYYPRSDFKTIPYIRERVACKLFTTEEKRLKAGHFYGVAN